MGMGKEAFFEDAVLEKNEKNNGNLKWLLFRISNLKKKKKPATFDFDLNSSNNTSSW